MRKYLALTLITVTGFAVAEGQNLSLDNLPENVAPSYTNVQKDVGNIPTTFPFQPPLVPHSIRGLQVTKNTNQCLGCHAPEVAQTTGATRVPVSHFLDRDGKQVDSTSPLRYFCLQCHVPQTDVNPIIQNKFETIKQTQGK